MRNLRTLAVGITARAEKLGGVERINLPLQLPGTVGIPPRDAEEECDAESDESCQLAGRAVLKPAP